MKTFFGTAALAASLVFGATAAGATDYKIAIVESLTGSVAFIGVPVRDGLLIGIDEINEKGLVGPGNKIVASVDDDAGDRGQALSLIARYAADPSVLMMVGPTTGAIAPSAAAAANDAKFPVFVHSNLAKVAEAGPWSFLFSQPSEVVIPNIVNYAVDKVKVKSCSIVTILDNEAYVALAKGFQDGVAAKGVKIAGYEGVKLADIDFSALGVKLAAGDEDCVFVSAPATMSANIITQLKQAGLNSKVKIFGHNAFSSPDLVKIGGAAVEGVYFYAEWAPGGSSPEGKDFAARYAKKFGREPDSWSPQGHAIAMIVADTIRRAGPNPTRESIRAALTATKDVPVIIGRGKYGFNEKRIPDFGVTVLTVKDGKFVAAP